MKPLVYSLFASLLIFNNSCDSISKQRIVDVTVLHLNDVYEIASVNNGTEGGYARLAYLVDSLRKKNPNLVVVHAGDFLSPSLIGNLKDENNNKIKGKHMVDVMNAAGVEVVTFGNHEFDIREQQLQNRIDESKFQWISANVYQNNDEGELTRFTQNKKPIPTSYYKSFVAGSDTFKLAITGVTLPFNKKDYVHYSDVESTLKQVLDTTSSDQFILLSHLEREQDRKVAAHFPSIPLIMGGHDHYHFMDTIGDVFVAKADANLRTVWKHNLKYNFDTKELEIKSELIKLDISIPESESVLKVVDKWLDFANEKASSSGYNMDNVIWQGDSIWECRETTIRSQQTNFGHAVAKSMLRFTGAEIALLNSGSLRYDDQLTSVITEGDILKALPFGGAVMVSEISGKELVEIAKVGLVTNVGMGGYLQIPLVAWKNDQMLINDVPVELDKDYEVCTSGFMAAGKETNLGILKNYKWQLTKPENGNPNDIRHITIQYFSEL